MEVKLLLDEKYVWAVPPLIKAAKKEIFIIAYLMGLPNEKSPGKEAILFKELLNAKKRGVDCRVILNFTYPANKIVKLNVEAGRWLKENKIECRYVARNRTVHAKMIIIDGVTLILGSHNWSRRAAERNVEASVEVRALPVVQEAREEFSRLWEDGRIMGETR